MAELRPKKEEIIFENSNNEGETPIVPVQPLTVQPPSAVPPVKTEKLKTVEIVYDDSDTEKETQPATTTTLTTTKAKKGKKEYEVAFNEETGTMTRTAKKEGILKPAIDKKKTYKSDQIVIVFHEETTAGQPEEWTAYVKKTGELVSLSRDQLPKELQEQLAQGDKDIVVSDLEKMKTFYRRRARDPNNYTYTPEGNLLIKGANGVADKVIPLRKFTSLTADELLEIETNRQTELVDDEEAYEDKMMELREAYTEYLNNGRRNPQRVFKINEELRELTVLRTSKAYPMRWISNIENPSTNEIILSQPHEVRKLGYPAYLFKRFPYKKEDSLGHYREAFGESDTVQEGGSMEMIFITDDNSIFHPSYPNEFVYEDIKFSSPYQAYIYAVFKDKGDEKLLSDILGTKSALTITNLVADKKDALGPGETIWKDILKELYLQKKEMAEALETSGTMTPFYLQDIKRFKETFNPKEYTNALASVRTTLRQEEEDGINPRSYSKSSISDEQQKKARTGAIVNMYRNKKF